MPQRHLTYTPHRKSNFDDSKKYTKFFSHFVLISAARIVYAFIYPALSCIESTILFAFTFFEAMTHALMFNQHTWFVCCRYVFHNFPHTFGSPAAQNCEEPVVDACLRWKCSMEKNRTLRFEHSAGVTGRLVYGTHILHANKHVQSIPTFCYGLL